jgi:formylglycine-generating enzyme required for sulfatase activity
VGIKAANELGIYDMSGNVWEWCWDWFDGSWTYPSVGTTDPKGPLTAQSHRLLRGGSFNNPEYNCRVVIRNYYYPWLRDYDYGGFIGFRCVQD